MSFLPRDTGVSTHDILSATHPDSHASDTPADGDVLTWVAANSRWEAVAGGAGGGVTQTYLGYNTIGGTMENTSSFTVYAKKITVATAGLLASIDAYIDWGQGDNAVSGWAAALYSDNAGTPNRVIAAPGPASDNLLLDSVNGAGGNTTGRWFGIPIGMWVTAADYWIAAHTTGGAAACRIAVDDQGSGSHDRTYNPGGRWFADWGWYTPTTTTKKYSLRASVVS